MTILCPCCVQITSDRSPWSPSFVDLGARDLRDPIFCQCVRSKGKEKPKYKCGTGHRQAVYGYGPQWRRHYPQVPESALPSSSGHFAAVIRDARWPGGSVSGRFGDTLAWAARGGRLIISRSQNSSGMPAAPAQNGPRGLPSAAIRPGGQVGTTRIRRSGLEQVS